jgi:hypothetical protein
MLKKILVYPVLFLGAVVMLIVEGFFKLLALLPDKEDKPK